MLMMCDNRSLTFRTERGSEPLEQVQGRRLEGERAGPGFLVSPTPALGPQPSAQCGATGQRAGVGGGSDVLTEEERLKATGPTLLRTERVNHSQQTGVMNK